VALKNSAGVPGAEYVCVTGRPTGGIETERRWETREERRWGEEGIMAMGRRGSKTGEEGS